MNTGLSIQINYIISMWGKYAIRISVINNKLTEYTNNC